MTKETLAAIDIGSNAIRLLICNVENEFKKAAFIRVPVRLGEDVFTAGSIGQSKGARLVEAMEGFAHIMRAFEVSKFRACATSAMREASNGSALVEEIRRRAGIEVEIISGHEEAELIFEAGDMAGLGRSQKSFLYVDVGGGSTEVTLYDGRHRVDSESFRLGTVRMLSHASDPEEMGRFKEWLKEVRKKYNPSAIVGSGGNINKAHKMLSKKEREPLRYVELKILFEELSDMTYEERMDKFHLNDYRADVIMPALHIFITAAHACRVDEIIVPKVGLVDGIIHHIK